MSVLILDQMTDTSTTSLASHTIAPTNVPGTSWTVSNGTTQIISNVANCVVANSLCYCDATVADQTIQAVINYGAGAFAFYLVGRLQDATNFWFGFLNTAGDTMFIFEQVAGSNTQRASQATAWVDGDTLQIAFSGTNITITHGSDTATYSSTDFQTQTKCGWYARATSQTVDNFQVDGTIATSPIGKIYCINQAVKAAAYY